jgi:hypothetical protein
MDPTFGPGGTVVTDFGIDESARDVAVQPDAATAAAAGGRAKRAPTATPARR